MSVAPMVFAVTPAAAEVTFTPLSLPIAAYTSTTCVYDLSGMADHKTVSKLLGCGKATFSFPMQKRSVPATFNGWGSPPATESSTPDVLQSSHMTGNVIHLRKPTQTVGFEAQPPVGVNGQSDTIVVDFLDSDGTLLGTISHTFAVSDRAVLFAARVKGATVAALAIHSHTKIAIANLRVDISG